MNFEQLFFMVKKSELIKIQLESFDFKYLGSKKKKIAKKSYIYYFFLHF